MARLKANQLPSYRLHKQSGQAIVTLSGKDFLLGKYDSAESRREYDRLTSEWILHGRCLPAEPDDLTIAEIVARFWTHAEKTYRNADGEQSGELGNFRHALQPLLDLYGDTAAAKFSPMCLRTVRERMLAARLCRNVINRRVNRIRHLFKWASGFELIPAAVHYALKMVEGLRRGRDGARESEPVRPAPDDVIDSILPELSSTVRAMVELQLLTGMRSTELCTFRGRDLDTTGGDGGKLWYYRPPQHKTAHHGYSRVVYLGPKAQDLIRPFLKPDLQAFIFSPADAERERREALARARKTPLSCGNRPGLAKGRKTPRTIGKRYDKNSYARAIARACEKAFPFPPELIDPPASGPLSKKDLAAQLERAKKRQAWRKAHHVHPHQFRHNAGTRLRKEFGVEAAQVILGQETLSVTELYAEKNVAAAQRIMAQVG